MSQPCSQGCASFVLRHDVIDLMSIIFNSCYVVRAAHGISALRRVLSFFLFSESSASRKQ